ncbi:MAG: hypothetical protein ACK56F_06570 [bacterium]
MGGRYILMRFPEKSPVLVLVSFFIKASRTLKGVFLNNKEAK